MGKLTAMALAALALAAAAGSAQAEFVVQGGGTASESAPRVSALNDNPQAWQSFGSQSGSQSNVAMRAPQAQTGVFSIGDEPNEPSHARGFARDVPLLTALKQITPAGWKARRVGDVDLTAKVSWRADNRSWVAVLDELARDQGFSATVNWDKHELIVSPAGGPARALIDAAPSQAGVDTPMAPQPIVMNSHPSHDMDGLSDQDPAFKHSHAMGRPAATVSREQAGSVIELASDARPMGVNPALRPGHPIAMAPIAQTWELSPSKTLKGNISDWAKRAGWYLSWDASTPDYPITVPVTFTGALDAEGGPLYQIALAYKDAEQPLTIRMLRGNKTIRVQKLDYEQGANSDTLPVHRASESPTQ